MGEGNFGDQYPLERGVSQGSCMKPSLTTPRIARWRAWAARFESRLYRMAAAFGVALLLHVGRRQTALRIQERWLHTSNQPQQNVHWSFRAIALSNLSQAFAKNLNFLTRVYAAPRDRAGTMLMWKLPQAVLI